MNLENKVVWLTGASSGIGIAIAKALIARGALVGITARNKTTLDQLSADLSQNGKRVVSSPGDVSDSQSMRECARQISAALGPIDILIANAGIHSESYPENFEVEEYLKIMDVNYGGLLNCMAAVIPDMKSRKAGVIAGVASLAGYRGLPRSAAYGASKSAMIHFMESARFHLRRFGIKVVIVNPGFVKTPMTDKNDFYMPFLLSPEQAAEYVLSGLEKEKIKIAFPSVFATLLEFARVIPYFFYDFLAERIWRRTERREELP